MMAPDRFLDKPFSIRYKALNMMKNYLRQQSMTKPNLNG
jgi:hypothetical protein